MTDRIVLDLPFPPSVNRIWRQARSASGQNPSPEHRRAILRSPGYRNWINQADRLVWATRRPGAHEKIAGPFTARITLDRDRRRIDLDNAIKVVLDFAQRIEVIANDRHCESILAEWGASCDAPHGCRLELTAIAARDAAE